MADLNDMSLLDLFLMESGTQSLSLAHELSLWEGGDGGGKVDFTVMHRAVHSITGAARIVDLQEVIDLTQAMEQGLRVAATHPTTEIRNLLEEATGYLTQLGKGNNSQIQEFLKEKESLLSELTKRLRALNAPSIPPVAIADTKAEPASPLSSFAGQGMFQIFAEDAENHLAVLSDNLIQIEKNPSAAVLLESSMRAVHSLKGAARVIGLTEIVTLTHIMEELFIAAQSRGLTLSSNHIDTLFSAADIIRGLTKEDDNTVAQWFEHNNEQIITLSEQINRIVGNQEETAAPPSIQSPKEPSPESKKDSGPPPIKTVTDRHLRVSSHGMNRILALASEVMVESRWLPALTTSLTRLKRQQDEAWYALEKFLVQLSESGAPTLVTSSLSDIAAKIKRGQDSLSNQIADLTEHSTHSVSISHRLHNEVITNRMQPLSEGLVGLPRLVRDLARKLNKSVRLEVIGAETLIDRDILEKLESPFTHIITNAIDHGIETQDEREKHNKPREATITLCARHHAGMMVITISDDGRGLDYDALRRKAVEKRLVSDKIAADLTEAELSHFLFLPNFTTKMVADSTSGRGVGLDIVHNAVREIRGSIELNSVAGQGLTFELQLPLTLSIIRGLLLEINNEPYALPLVNVDHAVRLPLEEVKEMGNRSYFIFNNRRVGLISAQQTLDLKERKRQESTLSVIVMSSGPNSYGLIVDRFDGIRDLVVQPLNPRLGELRSISAAAIAEDGTPILILDINDLRQAMDHLISGDRLRRVTPHIVQETTRSPRKRILVVDDSITVREVERKILTDHGFLVDMAVDGLDGWGMVRRNTYDLIITDIDMPNLDGIELLVHIKNSKELENIPVIILSYKDREEDKTRGLDAGADYYLTKSSFHDQALIEAVEDLIGAPGETR